MMVTEEMTFENFKALLVEKFGTRVVFREYGQDGWTSINTGPDGELKLDEGRPGPHWCDASPTWESRWLLGSFNFNTNTAKFFDLYLKLNPPYPYVRI